MDLEKIAAALQPKLKGMLKLREPMKNHVTWRVGGVADILVGAKCRADVEATIKYANAHRIPYYILGNGSNVLVLDSGIRGIVIKLAGGFNQVTITGQRLTAEAGARLPFLAKQACAQGLSGLEYLAAIPGTVGGAVIMNAGAHGRSIGEMVQKVTVLDRQATPQTLDKQSLSFAYRSSSLADQDLIVTEVELLLQPDNPVLIKERMEQFQAERKKKQPLNFPNAGSVFKNPPGFAAGYLIEKVGIKGLKRGGAQISEKHANFIVNTGNASAQDILDLIGLVQEKVYHTFNVQLETEIKVLGEG